MRVTGMKNAQGVVLIVALVFLAVLAALSVALLGSGTLDVKVATVAQERKEADKVTEGAVEETIQMAQTRVLGNNFFTLPENQYPAGGLPVTVTDSSVTTRVVFLSAAGCPRGTGWDSGINCNYLRIDADKRFGKNNIGQVQVGQGVAQQYFDGEQ